MLELTYPPAIKPRGHYIVAQLGELSLSAGMLEADAHHAQAAAAVILGVFAGRAAIHPALAPGELAAACQTLAYQIHALLPRRGRQAGELFHLSGEVRNGRACFLVAVG